MSSDPLSIYTEIVGGASHTQYINDSAIENDALSVHGASDPRTALACQIAANRNVADGLIGAPDAQPSSIVKLSFDPPTQ